MKHLHTLTIDEQLEILAVAQYTAIENEDFDEATKIEEMINNLIQI